MQPKTEHLISDLLRATYTYHGYGSLVDTLEQAVDAISDANVWKSIESAPRDGRPIIGWDGRDVTTCYYDGGWQLCVFGFNAEDRDFEPIKWVACPQAPES